MSHNNTNVSRFSIVLSLTPETCVLGLPVKAWDKALTGNYEITMESIKEAVFAQNSASPINP